MNKELPDKLLELFGCISLSHLATNRLAYIWEKLDLENTLKPPSREATEKAKSFSNPMDVEISGLEEEVDDWLTDGFESLIPDGSPIKVIPGPRPPSLPPGFDDAVECARILRALEEVLENMRLQQQIAERLERLEDAFSNNSNPILQLFAALFRSFYNSTQQKIAELDARRQWLVAQAINNECDISVPLNK